MLIPYSRQLIEDDDIAAVADALRSDWLTTGPQVEAFEAAFADAVEARYAVAVSSGTAGLHLACLAAELGTSGATQTGVCEGITSPITFAATSNALLYCGARPVFADICPDTVNLDPDQVERHRTERTRALLPVHFAGHACDMEALGAVAQRHGLTVIEDACHALGTQTPWGPVGNCRYSDMTVFSTHAVKAIATGEGGVVTTNRRDLYERLRLLRSHGITRDAQRLQQSDEGGWYYEMQDLGFNYRIGDAACALGHSQLKKLGRFIARRREIAARYDAAFQGSPTLRVLAQRPGHASAYHLYVVRFEGTGAEGRRRAFDLLRAAGLGVNVHYIPVYRQPHYRNTLAIPQDTCPNAESYYNEAISIPVHPGMTDEQVAYVIETVHRVACGSAH